MLLIAQTLLVVTHRTDLHRRLGLFTITASIMGRFPDVDLVGFATLFVSFDGLSLLLFGGWVVAAVWARRRPQTHKRLMIMATVSLLPPAFGRRVAYVTRVDESAIVLGLMCTTVAIGVLLDGIGHRRLHPALAWSGAMVVAVNVITYLAQATE